MAQANRDLPLVPSFAVKLNGRPLLPEMSMWIVNVVVEDELDLPGMFTLELISKETEQGSNPWSDEPRLALGATVEVSLGYEDDRESLMVGRIVSLEPTFGGEGPPSLLVRGFDLRYGLNGIRRTRSFVDKTDSSIAELIGSDAGVDIQATDSGVTHPYVMQADQTDLEFLRERARRIQYELAMEGSTMRFRPVANTGSSVVTLSLRNDLLEFRPRMSLVPVTGIQVLGWDPKEKQAIRSAAPATDAGDSVETLVRTPFASQAEADQVAVAAFNSAALEFIRGEGRVRGRTDVRAGRVVQLDELGTRFSGAYYLTSVVHRYSPRGYETAFRAEDGVVIAEFAQLVAAGASDPERGRILGVVVGKVTNNNDPDGLGRVKVTFPWLSDADESFWARIAAPMAGADRGIYFLPEIDDEVLVVFERGDVRLPYVIGSLWNGKDQVPASNADGKNNLRVIKSRSGHLIKLNDEEGKETVEIIDSSTRNSIVIDTASNTITISSGQDIVLAAPDGSITLTAKQIAIESSADTKITAGAGMDVTAGDTLNIAGSTVNIN